MDRTFICAGWRRRLRIKAFNALAGLAALALTAWGQPPMPENGWADQPLNEGWLFLRANPAGAEQAAFDDHGWRTIDLPHDWSIEDLVSANDDPLYAVINLVPGAFKFSAGDKRDWSARDFDDSPWTTVTAPASWKSYGVSGDKAWGWYRCHFTIPDATAGKHLFLTVGVIHDQNWIYIDGQKVSESGSGMWSNAAIKSWTVEVPAEAVTPGNHVIAIRVRGGSRDGGIVAAVSPPVPPSPCDPQRSGGNISTGYAVGGTGWYRKHFTLPPSDAHKHVRVVFDGSYMETSVWLNGNYLGKNVYGYSPFGFDLTPFLKTGGEENVLAVKVDNLGANSRWYSGSGIFRPVHLEFGGAGRLALWGLAATTSHLSGDQATIEVTAKLEPSAPDSKVTISFQVLDPDGKVVAKAEAPVSNQQASCELAISTPRLWSPDTADLYQVVATVEADGGTTETRTASFGIRTLAWNAREGLLLNGKSIKLRGGCFHDDFGPLGSASFPMAEWRRVKILKDAGYNAVRCSHNMPSTAFLEACDRLGMLVIDEAFDMWSIPKNPMDYSRFFAGSSEKDLGAMIERDRNHPSVIMWSIGNEIPERYDPAGMQTARRLTDFIRSIDRTRPVTAAFNDVNNGADGFFQALDICGYNYCPDAFMPDHARRPNRIMFTTESYPKDSIKYWSLVEKCPYVIGDFVWTAWDYRGESGIGHTLPTGEKSFYLRPWPCVDAFCGDFDVCGFVKPQGLFRQVMWGARKLAILVDDLPPGQSSTPDSWGWRDELPVWNWPNDGGILRTVRVYGKGDSATLLLNGKWLGTQKINKENTASFQVAYQPGKLVAQLHRDGKVVAEESLETTGEPASLQITAEVPSLPADKESIAFLRLSASDSQGRSIPTADEKVTVSVSGPGLIAAFGNGDPDNVGSVQIDSQRLWRGSALLVIRSTGAPGVVDIAARSPGLKDGRCQIHFTSPGKSS